MGWWGVYLGYMEATTAPTPNTECPICEVPTYDPRPNSWASSGGYCDNHDPSDEPNYDEMVGFEASMERKYPLLPGFGGI